MTTFYNWILTLQMNGEFTASLEQQEVEVYCTKQVHRYHDHKGVHYEIRKKNNFKNK